MNPSMLTALALAISAPFISNLDPGTDAPPSPPTTDSAPAQPPVTPAPAAATPVATPAPKVSPIAADPRIAGSAAKQPATAAANNAALSNMVAEAIKRKLDRVAAAKINGGVEVPNAPAATPAPIAPNMETPIGMPFGPGGGFPEPSMMSGGARVMMGSPTDGSPSYVRNAAASTTDIKDASPPAVAPAIKASDSNPLVPAVDPMEAGTDSAAAVSQPGPNHNLLDIFVGTWDVSANFDTGPGQPPETASGQMVNTWQLEGRWLKQEYSGQMASLGAFRGLGFLGYDNLQKTFVGTWMDTLSTSCLMSKGGFDETHATFTLSGDFTVPGGEKYKQKQVMTILSPDRYVVSMYLAGPDGVEFKTGNLEYTRSVNRVTIAGEHKAPLKP